MREIRDEARLTAYVLGELPESEHAELERRLTASEELRQEAEEIRAMAAALRQALTIAPLQKLTQEQRSEVEVEACKSTALRFQLGRQLTRYAPLTVAASLALVAVVVWRFIRMGVGCPGIQRRATEDRPGIPSRDLPTTL